jgi:hypothetical protein
VPSFAGKLQKTLARTCKRRTPWRIKLRIGGAGQITGRSRRPAQRCLQLKSLHLGLCFERLYLPPIDAKTSGASRCRVGLYGPCNSPGGDLCTAQQKYVQGLIFLVSGQWWTLFRSKALKDLVERAIRDNPDLKTGQAALAVAAANSKSSEGACFLTRHPISSCPRSNGRCAPHWVAIANRLPPFNLTANAGATVAVLSKPANSPASAFFGGVGGERVANPV